MTMDISGARAARSQKLTLFTLALVVQWIECELAELVMQVRFLPRAPDTGAGFIVA